jgi:hypothetical protein
MQCNYGILVFFLEKRICLESKLYEGNKRRFPKTSMDFHLPLSAAATAGIAVVL